MLTCERQVIALKHCAEPKPGDFCANPDTYHHTIYKEMPSLGRGLQCSRATSCLSHVSIITLSVSNLCSDALRLVAEIRQRLIVRSSRC